MLVNSQGILVELQKEHRNTATYNTFERLLKAMQSEKRDKLETAAVEDTVRLQGELKILRELLRNLKYDPNFPLANRV